MNNMKFITLSILNILSFFSQMNVDQNAKRMFSFYTSYHFRITRLKFNIYFILEIRTEKNTHIYNTILNKQKQH